MNKTVWYATQNKERVSPALDDENDAWVYIQKHQGQSVDYAMRWGGWGVESAEVPDDTPTTNRTRYFRVD